MTLILIIAAISFWSGLVAMAAYSAGAHAGAEIERSNWTAWARRNAWEHDYSLRGFSSAPREAGE